MRYQAPTTSGSPWSSRPPDVLLFTRSQIWGALVEALTCTFFGSLRPASAFHLPGGARTPLETTRLGDRLLELQRLALGPRLRKLGILLNASELVPPRSAGPVGEADAGRAGDAVGRAGQARRRLPSSVEPLERREPLDAERIAGDVAELDEDA